MKYFAKYIVQNRNIKIGDTIVHKGEYHKVIASTFEGHMGPADDDDIFTNDGETLVYKSCLPVQLFLCSREVEVGDQAHYYGDHDLSWKIDSISQSSFKSGSGEHPLSTVYKVIGPISPLALWVKEGDEFEEEDIRYHTMLDDTLIYIRVKGPCGHFH